MLYKQLIRLIVENACPICRSAAHTHVRKLYFGIFLTVRFTRIWEFHFFFFFADRIIILTEGFDLNLAGVGNPLFRQLGRYMR